MGWRFILALLFAVVISVFAIQNAAVVGVNFLAYNSNISQALVILISAIIGAIVAMLLGIVRWLKQQSKIKTTTKQVSKLEEENKQLQLKLEGSEKRILELELENEKKVIVESIVTPIES